MAKIHDLRCFIVADDLTGCCDTAVHFAVSGMAAEVAICHQGWSLPPTAQVAAINTDSRCIPEEAARHRVRAAFGVIEGRQCEFLFKKIDSSLRGNVFTELNAAAEASSCDSIWVAPALPALNRRVRSGDVCLPDGRRLSIAEVLHPLPVTAVSVNELRSPATLLAKLRSPHSRGDAVCFDAETDSDLEAIVALGLACGQRVLWAGSAGLAGAIARTVARNVPRTAASSAVSGTFAPVSSRPVLFGIGSNHAASLAQIEGLRGAAPLLECSIESFSERAVGKAISEGRNVLLHLPRCGTDARLIMPFAEAAPLTAFGGIVLAGGDTAAAFLRALGAHTLRVQCETMPGVPVSIIRGGAADGMTVVTKSGAFGDADALIECVKYLQGVGAMRAESGAGA